MRSFFLGTMLGLLGVAIIGCANGVVSQEPLGKLSANVVIAPGFDVTEINFEITGPGIDTITGTIPVTTNPVVAMVGGILVGTGYTIKLSTADGKCSGSTVFDVTANQTTAATVKIQCAAPPPARGSVEITAPVMLCPTITSAVVSPSKVDLGGTIQVKAAAKDPSGGALTYAWTATAGTFADATAAATTYSCSVAGSQTLTIKVSNADCNDSLSINVDCTGGTVVCGDGVVSGGENCDKKITSGPGVCPTSCNDNDPCTTDILTGKADDCSAKCTFTPITTPVCGDGCVSATEQCEPPNTTTCDANCQKIVPPTCGNGVVDTADGETCDTLITSGAGVCPTGCNGGTTCTPITLDNAGTCKAACVSHPKTPCCGNGVKEAGETCDTAIAAGQPDACPTDCKDNDPCTVDTLQNNGTCTAACTHTAITTPVCGDGCVSGTEQCEPPNTTTCDANCQNIVCADITGTWILHLNTTGTITQGTVVIPNVNIDYIIRLYNRKESGNLVSTIQICELAAGATGLVTSYSDAVIKTFTVSGSKPDFCAKVKGPVTIPTFQILSGTKSATLPTGTTSPCSTNPTSTCDAAPDTDADGKYGITLTTTLGVLTITTYTGLVITISLNDMVLDNATTMSGTTSFTSNGFVWGTSLLGVGVGPIIIALDSNAIPIESFLLPGHGEVLCPQVVNYCTTGPTGVCTP